MINTPHDKRPDIDNLVKFMYDCLTGIAFNDDGQIYSELNVKLWSANPRTEIVVSPYEGEQP